MSFRRINFCFCAIPPRIPWHSHRTYPLSTSAKLNSSSRYRQNSEGDIKAEIFEEVSNKMYTLYLKLVTFCLRFFLYQLNYLFVYKYTFHVIHRHMCKFVKIWLSLMIHVGTTVSVFYISCFCNFKCIYDNSRLKFLNGTGVARGTLNARTPPCTLRRRKIFGGLIYRGLL